MSDSSRSTAARLASAVLAGTLAAACTGGGARRDAKPAPAVEDEETGVNRITGLVRELNRAIDGKDFDTAGARLREVETGVERASELTRGHPDFEEIEERVRRARPRLEAAIERDRIERRNAAINDLVRRGDQLMQRGGVLLTELARRVPEVEDMADLRELIDAFAAIEREGALYLDEPRYKEHTVTRERVAATLVGRRRQAEWQIQTSGAVGRTIALGFDEVSAAKAATAGSDQLAALRRATDAFTACVNAIADAESLGGYEPSSVLTTRMGTLAGSETKRRCLETSAKVRGQADRLAFHERTAGIARRVSDTLRAFEGAPTAAEKVPAAEAAITALSQCSAELESARRGAGYDASLTYDTPLGSKLNPDKLRRACGDERTRLAASLPAWGWRKSFAGMKNGLATIKQRIDEAGAATDTGAQIRGWQLVLESLASCVEKARALLRDRNADARYSFVSAFGNLTARAVESECELQRVVAEAQLGRAVEAQSIEGFAATCRGDEVQVVRQHGVPTQVVPVEGGRVFVFGKAPGAKRFGFDAGGRAVDFAVRWREQVGGIAAEMARVTAATNAATTGAAMLEATQAAIPVLDVCVEALTGTERHPGFDGKRRFATELGKLTAVEMRAACDRRRGELAASLRTLAWRAQLEAIRDRAVDAYMQVEEARAGSDVAKRVKESGAALGSYRECVERAEAMAGEPDADKRATVNGPFGPVTIVGLARACKAEIGHAQETLDAALAAQKLERFLATCKADEADVVRREGMPDRVESLGTGRVFVFHGKAKKGRPRRVAFDAGGSRVEEASLRR